MATPQTYASTDAVTIPTHTPTDQGGTLIYGTTDNGIGGTEHSYPTGRDTSAQMFEEIQRLVGLFTRATTSGLGLAPRAAMLKMKMILEEMLRQPNV